MVLLDGRFVPRGVDLDLVDEAWQRVRARVPRAFDGPMLHVVGTSRNGHGGVTIHCIESSYRFAAVAQEGVRTGMRGLGVKGISMSADGRVLMARRGPDTLNYAGEWEFAPGGCVEPGVALAEMLLRELGEETGWTAAAPPVARALVFDPHALSWEVVFSINVRPPEVPVEGWECSELRLVQPGEWPEPLSAVARQMIPVARSVADALERR